MVKLNEVFIMAEQNPVEVAIGTLKTVGPIIKRRTKSGDIEPLYNSVVIIYSSLMQALVNIEERLKKLERK